MKKFALIALALVTAAVANEPSFEKEGFLTTEKCAKAGKFKDCYYENYFCGSDECFKETEAGVNKHTPLVLFSHDDGVVYKLDLTRIPASEVDEGIGRNAVLLTGEYDADTNTIIVHEFKAPPPSKKSFFKGCL